MFKPNFNTAPLPVCDPGEFRHEVTLLEQRTTTDVSGVVAKWDEGIDPLRAYCKIEYLRGAEMIKGGIDTTQAIIKLTSWYRPEFTVQQRLRLPNGAHFRIQYLENVREMNTFMILTCIGIGSEDR